VSAKFRYRPARIRLNVSLLMTQSMPIRIAQPARGEVEMFTASLQVSNYVTAVRRTAA